MSNPYKSGNLQKITNSLIQTRVGGFTDELQPDRIGINKDIFNEVTEMELPAEVRIDDTDISKERVRKPLYFRKDFVEHYLVDPEEAQKPELQGQLYRGSAILSEHNRYYDELQRGDRVTLNLTPSMVNEDKYLNPGYFIFNL